MKATISLTPYARRAGIPEIVESIEVGMCMRSFQFLSAIAHRVHDEGASKDPVAEIMAYQILLIEKTLLPQIEQIRYNAR